MRKKIGIVGHPTGEGKSFGLGLAYVEFFSKFGDVQIIGHTETTVREDLDLVVVPGGPDVEVSRYLNDSDVLSVHTGRPCLMRERFDRVLLPKYIENKTPILGICRGHQSIAVHFGAKLVQHMEHENNTSYDRKKTVHQVLVDNAVLRQMGIDPAVFLKPKDRNMPITNLGVNSIHHQVVANVPTGAVKVARHSVDQSIEALYYPDHNIYTVQWHPEECEDIISVLVIKKMLNL